MPNVTASPKSDTVTDADFARAAAVGDRVQNPRIRDVGGIHLADDLDSLTREEIEATLQHNLRATLAAARQSTAVWRRFPGLQAVETVADLY
jgi:phenylacetate-CoA ligase